jgi:hypothetical protein
LAVEGVSRVSGEASAKTSSRGKATIGRRARQLDAAQRLRLDQVTRDAALLYPTEPELQQAAVQAAVDYLHGSVDLADVGARWLRVRGEGKRLEARARQLAVMAVADKMFSERFIARALGIDRMRLRRWSGKRQRAAVISAPGRENLR